ncbi:hypothetical protein GEV33_007564 [Tenebrio molitor]|uniref:Uncharacterized protein n=1 Tax=Tenebrio molitor TaxID=7067 RepID=A0A8J6LC29_TENMO|nr:hypothetical protein GEV33_007564 [Tenebrio molitor]
MKRLVPNEVPITSNYEEITIWDEIIKISNEDTITGENLLTLKTNIEMKLGSKLQEMGSRVVQVPETPNSFDLGTVPQFVSSESPLRVPHQMKQRPSTEGVEKLHGQGHTSEKAS